MTVEESKVRWGVMSTALYGTAKVIPAMQAAKFCDIRAIASRNLEKAEATAAELGIPTAYGSYEELLADPEIDAIYNPLPNHLHVPISIQALEAGKHVLCEKPIGLTAAEGQQLVDERELRRGQVEEVAAVATGFVLQVAHVLDNPKQGHVHLLEHAGTPTSHVHRHLLRRGHDYGTGERQSLGKG